jgi:hypothetical protein
VCVDGVLKRFFFLAKTGCLESGTTIFQKAFLPKSQAKCALLFVVGVAIALPNVRYSTLRYTTLQKVAKSMSKLAPI